MSAPTPSEAASAVNAPKPPRRRRLSKAQREWCERYERETTFEPLMCDYLAGNQSFVEAARFSLRWFEDWANDAFLRASEDIPGELP
jgi:hypothetical protein